MIENTKPNFVFRFINLLTKGFVRVANFTRHFLLILIFIAGLIWFLNSNNSVYVKSNSALVLAPVGMIVNQYTGKPTDKIITGLNSTQTPETQLRDILRVIKSAATDKKISVLVLNPDSIWGVGLADLKEIELAIKNFKEKSNKPVIAVADNLSQNQYYFANLADEIILDPQGFMFFSGYESFRNYFKDGLDKLGVDVHLFKVGEYKSAAEPYVRNDMSEPAKESALYYMNDLWSTFIQGVSDNRKIPFDEFSDIIEQQSKLLKGSQGNIAKMYKKAGLIDQVKNSHFKGKYIASYSTAEKNSLGYRYVVHDDYLETLGEPKTNNNNVAVVVAEGSIVNGSQDQGMIGGDSTSQLLREARFDNNVKAVVLRVNSPGGSVFASEQIRREIEALKVAGKPVVASMGNVAASGGYWISMSANKIFAHDATITGSIGIFGMITTFPKMLNKIGVNTDGVGTSSWSGAFRIDKGISDELQELIQTNIDHGYQQFIQMVASTRNMDIGLVDQVARGRVWTAKQAIEFGLIDELGGQQKAIEEAAKLAKIQDDYQVLWIEEELSFWDELALNTLENVFSGVKTSNTNTRLLQNIMTPLKTQLNLVLNQSNESFSSLAHCFCEVRY